MIYHNSNEEKLNSNENEEIKTKRNKRIIVIFSLVLLIAIIIVIIVLVTRNNNEDPKESDSQEHPKDSQEVPNNYEELEDNNGELEKKFSKIGEFEVDKKEIQFSERQKFRYIMFFPKNESYTNTEVKYPIIIFLNNIGKSYEINQPIFNHLASYGFVVITNDDKNTSNGESIKEIKDNIENLNKNESFILYHKLDLNNIGVSCHDQSVISLLRITNDISLRQKIKSVFCAGPLPQTEILTKKYYYFYKNMTFKNIFFITPSIDSKFKIKKYFKEIIMSIPRNSYDKALIARRNLTTRDNILWKSDSYHTAWFLSTLKDDETAKKIFNETNGEILQNHIWEDTFMRSEEQISEGDAAIYISDNFRNFVDNDGFLEKKYAIKGDINFGTYEILCDPNIEKCAQNWIFNYVIYYPLDIINNNKKYPLIVFSNSLNYSYYYITPLLEHLSSWGFVVIANDEGNSYLSIGVRESLRYMINLNKDNNSIFYDKIDLDNIGFSGHSAGASGILYYTNFEYEDELKNLKIKSLFPSCINNLAMISRYFNINIDFTKVNIPYIFLTSSTQEGNENILNNTILKRDFLDKMKNKVYHFIARKNNTMHHNFYWKSVGYQTAWFLYTLTNNSEAKSVFEPKSANGKCDETNKNGICLNELWYDIEYSNNAS